MQLKHIAHSHPRRSPGPFGAPRPRVHNRRSDGDVIRFSLHKVPDNAPNNCQFLARADSRRTGPAARSDAGSPAHLGRHRPLQTNRPGMQERRLRERRCQRGIRTIQGLRERDRAWNAAAGQRRQTVARRSIAGGRSVQEQPAFRSRQSSSRQLNQSPRGRRFGENSRYVKRLRRRPPRTRRHPPRTRRHPIY